MCVCVCVCVCVLQRKRERERVEERKERGDVGFASHDITCILVLLCLVYHKAAA